MADAKERKRAYYAANKHRWYEYARKNKARIRAYRLKRYRLDPEYRERKKSSFKKCWHAKHPEIEIKRENDRRLFDAEVKRRSAADQTYMEKLKDTSRRSGDNIDSILRRRIRMAEHVKKLREDPAFYILSQSRWRLGHIFRKMRKSGVYAKKPRTIDLIGCTAQDLVHHIESKFQDGMTWANRGQGKGRWHIDRELSPSHTVYLTECQYIY